MKSLISICFILLILQVNAQDITGDWHGLREYPGRPLRMILHISDDNGILTAEYDSPENDLAGLKIDSISFQNNNFYLRYENADVTFTGIVDLTNQTITGTYYGGEDAMLLTLTREPIPAQVNGFAYLKENYSREEVYITMRDGVRLFTSIYAPKNKTEDHPILLVRTPYNIEPEEDKYSNRLFNMTHLLQEGYIIVFQDIRGRFMSEGQFVDVRPYIPNKKKKEIDENSDTYDTIDWLINNVDNNNGNVGIFGISYPGFYSTMALPDAHPALKAASPQAPVGNWFIGDDWHHNGAFLLMDAFWFYSSVGRPRPEPTREYPSEFDVVNPDNYDFFMDLGPVKNVQKKYFGDTIQFWSDLMTHPDYDDFWKARDPMPHLKDVKPAVLVVGGWFDAEDLFGPLETYKSIETLNPQNQNRLIMGPWSHGQWAGGNASNMGNIHWGSNTSDFFKDVELKFFNFYLKDKGTMDLAEATIFITGSNEWKTFDNWPPVSATEKRLFLRENGGLSFSAPGEEGFDEYIADPNKPVPYTEDVHKYRTRAYLTDDQRFASRRQDVMVYQTDVLDEKVVMTGPLEINFFVTTTGTDADYVVKLIDVFPDDLEDYPENNYDGPMGGYQMLVRGEVLRGRYRNSFENPEAFVPGEITEVSFTIPDLAHSFEPGHKIMIQVQNSWFPLVDRNPQQFVNIYECDEEDFIRATHRIYHDAQRPSSVTVRILGN